MLFWKKESQISGKINGFLNMDFKNLEFNIENLPKFEEVNLQPISKKYGWIILFNWGMISVILLTAILVLNLIEPQLFGKFFKYVFGGAILFLMINYIISYFGFFTKKYAIRTHDIIYQHGLIKSNTIIIPFNRIQHVNLEEGWLSRVLEIKSISIYTAGQDNGDLKINGLEKDLSEKINQLILNKIKVEKEEIEVENAPEISEDES